MDEIPSFLTEGSSTVAGDGGSEGEWKFRTLSDAVAEVVVTLDRQGLVQDWNEAAATLFGYDAGEAVGRNFLELVSVTGCSLDHLKTASGSEACDSCRMGVIAKRSTGENFPIEVSFFDAPPQYGGGTLAVARTPAAGELTTSLLQQSRERLGTVIAQQAEMEKAFAQRQARDERLIWQLMHHDSLSGLPNRLLMMERASVAMIDAESKGLYVGMLVVGVNHFSYINDVLGHVVGDFIMTTVAAKLKECLGPTDTLAHLDSTEFCVVLPGLKRQDDVEKVAERLIEAVAQPVSVAGHELVVSAGIGIAVFPADGLMPEALVKNATAAMYQVERDGNTGWQRYSASKDATALERLSTEEDLRRALGRGEFEVYYQPQVDVRKGMIDGAEALIRWRRPGYGLVSPASFIPLAEENGTIVAIGAWVLEQACAQLKAWHEAGANELRMAVNLSARQFHQCDLGERVSNVLKRTGLAPNSLELEITESMLMGDTQRGAAVLHQFKQLGVRLALDDFGTGYSSLNYLKRFPVDTLKIDQSFVKRIPQDSSDSAIVRAIIALAQSLQLNLVAEGVETHRQLDFMRQHGCNLVQGYLFSPPVQASEFERHLGSQIHSGAN